MVLDGFTACGHLYNLLSRCCLALKWKLAVVEIVLKVANTNLKPKHYYNSLCYQPFPSFKVKGVNLFSFIR